jgi:hypothetical protein
MFLFQTKNYSIHIYAADIDGSSIHDIDPQGRCQVDSITKHKTINEFAAAVVFVFIDTLSHKNPN